MTQVYPVPEAFARTARVDAARYARDYARNLEHMLGDLGSHDVPVVAFCNGDEAVRVLDTGPPQDVGVGAIADHLVAFEIGGQDASGCRPGKLVGVAVDDDHFVAGLVHVRGDLRPNTTTPHDQQLQGG